MYVLTNEHGFLASIIVAFIIERDKTEPPFVAEKVRDSLKRNGVTLMRIWNIRPRFIIRSSKVSRRVYLICLSADWLIVVGHDTRLTYDYLASFTFSYLRF